MASDAPSISEWFHGRNVFITGGTGFMGKILIYKLLISCHNLGNIFVLMRKKRDLDPYSRLQQMIQEEPFKIIKEKYPERLKKIIIIPGDSTVEDLALSTADKERLLKEVSVVFNAAANVKFDLTLKQAVNSNTVGAMNVLNIAKQMPHLDAFIHLSTAYSHSMYSILEEKCYPCTIKPETMIENVKNMTDEVLEAMKPKLLQDLPNTYTFSKALSEELVRRSGLPTGIARPSIVTPSWKEPAVGWVDNINGPTGLLIGAGKGVLRTMLGNKEYRLNVIPCDMAINAVIAFAWKIGREKPKEPLFMNVTNAPENPLTWDYSVNIGKKYAISYPFSGILWYPGGSITTSKFYHILRIILFQYIPAYVIDALLLLSGNKPFMVNIQDKVTNGIQILKYYTNKEWEFRQDRMKALQLELNPSDREEFFMDTTAISWDTYMLQYVLGVRKYYLKDDPSTLPRARRVMRCMYFADWFVKIGFTILVLWFLFLDKFIQENNNDNIRNKRNLGTGII
ncbi:LOW QUALITY PROTEIN: putative fatty acyl-CoA reductase CG5065 [Osmia lignaria lignaria]|uniref:LOW QUALITY PROTEIN: putative fatty acyl-CoA reductase CG5065 n=1 Tax=Osmia lignaria lignaria TaxID=1437193 RepID=UPI00402BA59F